ncbi:MAG: DNA polymerase Y family protein [Actinomycetota bacterium]|nr:DNA polymerase Y family protein [Actinomycetota bacterium]
MLAIWCPDWPVTAVTPPELTAPDAPVSTAERALAVITANHVVACSHPARQAGVRRGMRRREAQSRCPDLVILPRDELAEARAFEPVVGAIESITPGVELTRPGLAAIAAKGPTRYFGSEAAVVHALSRRVSELTADVLIGAAEGSFAAEQAARHAVLVPPGESASFLADLPIGTVDHPELVDLLVRLGIRTLGAFAALPARDVLARFGPTGAWVHRQCGARDARPIAARPPAAEHTVDLAFEPPLERIDAVAFSARTTAERFVTGLLAHGLACTCFELIARTENGEETVRRWRHASVLTAVDVLDRIRWQLEGWLRGDGGPCGPVVSGASPTTRPTSGVTLLRLIPIQCVPTGAHQQSLWSGPGAGDERVHRALARVQTLLGHGSVLTPLVDGGREPAQRTRLVPWGDDPVPEHGPERPWPGRLPAPAPSVLVDPPREVQVLDESGRTVVVTARGAVPLPPARLGLGSGPPVPVTAWAGPWPVDDTWWTAPPAGSAVTGDAAGATRAPTRRARFQLVDLRGRAYLLTCEVSIESLPVAAGGARAPIAVRWTLDAIYD